MAISLTTDIVSDVLQAADPAAARAASERLARLQSSAIAELNGEFGALDAARTRPGRTDGTLSPHVPLVRESGTVSRAADEGSAAASYRKFEAFVLQVFVETMLPQNDRTFGKGTAGVVWRSMMAEQLGVQLSKSGGIGIARMLSKAHPAGASLEAAGTSAFERTRNIGE